MDNLNTIIRHHCTRPEPAEARRIAERLEKHGSWLNMAEIEIGVMARQCLDRRIPDRSVLRREAAAWQAQRNRDGIRVNWRFTTCPNQTKVPIPQYNTDVTLAARPRNRGGEPVGV